MESVENPRLARERKTIQLMIRMYCRDHHERYGGEGEGLCPECRELETYARARLTHCPFGVEKPTCAQCIVHCYKPAMRQQVKIVMKYAGPRMMIEHPVYAIWHVLDGRRDHRLLKKANKAGRG